MARPSKMFEHRGFAGMKDVSGIESDQKDLAFWIENVVPSENGRFLAPRPGFTHAPAGFGKIAAGTGQHVCSFYNATNGAVVFAVVAGQIYKYSASGDSWSLAVSTANFTTAGITMGSSARVFGRVTLNGSILLTPGAAASEPPFTYNGGTGATAVTRLADAPAVPTGEPTVHAAKAFFIKSDRLTVAWSEENDATTGYEAGGYNNAWTLSQTASEPLTAIVGTNAGLYYFRQRSIGLISGSVSSDFATTSTHDAVSEDVGLGNNHDGYYLHRGTIYFADQYGRPQGLRIGGTELLPLWEQMARHFQQERGPLPVHNKYEALSIGGGDTTPFTLDSAVMQVTYNAPTNQILFWYGTGVSGSGTYVWAAGFNATTNQLTSIWRPNKFGNANYRVFASINLSRITTPSALSDTPNGIIGLSHDGYAAYSVEGNPPSDTDGDSQEPYNMRIIGPADGWNADTDWFWDEIQVILRHGTEAMTVTHEYATSHAPWSTEMAASQSQTLAARSAGVGEGKASFGLNGYGRWCRPMITIAKQGGGSFANTKVGIVGYRLRGLVDATEPAQTR